MESDARMWITIQSSNKSHPQMKVLMDKEKGY